MLRLSCFFNLLRMNAFTKHPDGSYSDASGRLVFASVSRFYSGIVEGDSCFVCLHKPNTKRFNNEHVIPNWILRNCKIERSNIVLPNQTDYPYSRYQIPCCAECNSELGEIVESPISLFLKNEHKEILDWRQSQGSH